MSNKSFKSIAGRWREHAALLPDLTAEQKAQATLMFYAGFAAALQAVMEVGDYSETQGCFLLEQMTLEATQFGQMAKQTSDLLKKSSH